MRGGGRPGPARLGAGGARPCGSSPAPRCSRPRAAASPRGTSLLRRRRGPAGGVAAPAGVRGGVCVGGGEQRPRAPAGEADPEVKCFPGGGSVGTARSREQAAAEASGGAAARGSAYLCLGAEGGPGSLAPAGPASRVTPPAPSAGLRESAAELVPGLRRRRRRRRGERAGGRRARAGSGRQLALRLGGLGQRRAEGGFSSKQPAGRLFWG